MNTTGLIAQWSMSGARQDLSEQFRPVGEVEAAQPSPEPDPVEAPVTHLLVKRPDEDEWQPLAAAGGRPGG
jgi:hypothetical protein